MEVRLSTRLIAITAISMAQCSPINFWVDSVVGEKQKIREEVLEFLRNYSGVTRAAIAEKVEQLVMKFGLRYILILVFRRRRTNKLDVYS